MGETASASILIVDDVPENIEIVESILAPQGYRLFSAGDGEEALAMCRQQAFDLVLLDVMMPQMDGFEVCRRLRELPGVAHLPIIFVTAKTDLDSVVEGFEAGGTDYVTKPFYARELIARVRTQVRLWQTEQELRRLNAAKDRYLNLIGSELKRPFIGLRGVLATLVEGADQMERGALQEYARLAEDSATHLGRLLENLLQWRDTQAAMAPPHPQELMAGALVEDGMAAEQALFEQKGVGLEHHVPTDLRVRADRQMATTVIRNLLTNAVMFSHPGDGVEAGAREQDGEAVFWVRDQGVGIGPEDQARVFSMDNPSPLRRPGTGGELGTGIGLMLCRELLEENGGRIWIDSALGRGTTVYFSLPLAARPEPAGV